MSDYKSSNHRCQERKPLELGRALCRILNEKKGLDFFTRRSVLGRLLVQIGHHLLGRRGYWNDSLKDDVTGVNSLPVEALVGAIVRAYCGTRKRDADKKAAGTRVRKDLRPQGDVGGGFGVASLGTCSGRSVSAEFHFAAEEGLGAPLVHHQEYEIRSLRSDLQPETSALQGHHRRCAPRPGKILAGATDHCAAAIAAAKGEGELDDGRVNDNAVGFVNQVLGNVVRDVHDFLHDRTAVFQPLFFLLVIGLEREGDERKGQENGKDLLHECHLLCYEVPIVYDEMAWVAEWARQSQIAGTVPCSDSVELRRRELPQAFEYTFMWWLLPIEEL